MLLKQAIAEHAGKSGAQLSAGAEMETYDDQAAVTNFAANLARTQAGNLAIVSIECNNRQGQTEVISFLATTSTKYTESVRWLP